MLQHAWAPDRERCSAHVSQGGCYLAADPFLGCVLRTGHSKLQAHHRADQGRERATQERSPEAIAPVGQAERAQPVVAKLFQVLARVLPELLAARGQALVDHRVRALRARMSGRVGAAHQAEGRLALLEDVPQQTCKMQWSALSHVISISPADDMSVIEVFATKIQRGGC